MTLSHSLYVSLMLLVMEWRDECSDDVRAEHLEACRECFRSILGILGVHRSTEVFAEAWILLTEVKICTNDDLQALSPSTIQIEGACPAAAGAPLRALTQVPHADILEEEISGCLDFVDAMQAYHGSTCSIVAEWLRDLRFMLDAAFFAILRRWVYRPFWVQCGVSRVWEKSSGVRHGAILKWKSLKKQYQLLFTCWKFSLSFHYSRVLSREMKTVV